MDRRSRDRGCERACVPGPAPAGADYSSDYRLSAYGAIAFGLGGEWHFRNRWTGSRDWILKLGWERYFSSEDLSHDDTNEEVPGLVDYDVWTIGVSMLW